MSAVLKPDLCVIGAGSGGLSVAAVAASFGVPVVLIERGTMGGDCLNVGCVPSKALLAAAASAQGIRDAARFGVVAGAPQVDGQAVRDHVRGVVSHIAPNDSAERFAALGVKVIRAPARFTGPRRLEAGGHVIEARRFVIATGSRPAVPPIPGLADLPYLTNETIFDLAARPERLLVLGGGAVGAELAQACRRLGSAVTLLEAERLLSREDPEAAAVVERSLRREGVEILDGARVEAAAPHPDGVALTVRRGDRVETLTGTHLLVATGRRPVTEDLGLEAAGIDTDASGIVVDRRLRTRNRRVYAIGDCAGGPAAGQHFTHGANHQAGLVVRNALFRLPVRVDATPLPRVTYTDPELAAVGLSEEEARGRHRKIRILRWPLAENDRAQAERRTEGHVKVITTPGGRILGCTLVGAHAGELVTPWVLAMTKGLNVRDLAGIVVPYPTFSEISRRAAVEFLRPSAASPWVRRVIGLARRLG